MICEEVGEMSTGHFPALIPQFEEVWVSPRGWGGGVMALFDALGAARRCCETHASPCEGLHSYRDAAVCVM